MADFETFRQGAEQGGSFPGQDPGQPMSHAHQDKLALPPVLKLLSRPGTWRSFTCPEGLMGKHGLGAAGEFIRERFRDGFPEGCWHGHDISTKPVSPTSTGMDLEIVATGKTPAMRCEHDYGQRQIL